MTKELDQANLHYQDPNSIELTKGEKWSNFWNRTVAKLKGESRYPQIGLLPTGDKGIYTVVNEGHKATYDLD